MDRIGAIREAVLRLNPDEFTTKGKPRLAAMNAKIKEIDEARADASVPFEPMKTPELNSFWREVVAGAEGAGAATAQFEVEPGDVIVDSDSPPAGFMVSSVKPMGTTIVDDAGEPVVHAGVAAVEPDLDDEMATITITESMSNPLQLYIHGRGLKPMYVGGLYKIPRGALDALRGSDAKWIEHD